MAKLQLSPTRIGTFLTCTTLYKYDYYDKIGKFYHKSHAGNALGSTLHHALQGFVLAGGAASESAEDLVSRAMESWRSVGYENLEQEAQHKELAAKILAQYHTNALAAADKTTLFLAEKQIKLDMGSFWLTGRVDRIDQHVSDGALEIIDYKSGRETITPEDVEQALAMCVYQLILKRLYPNRRVMATIVALRSGNTATVELTDQQLDTWESDIKDIARQIFETDWESVRPIFMPEICPTCDYLKLCERYWKQIETYRQEEVQGEI